MKTFGERLRYARERRLFGSRELARKAGLASSGHVSLLESRTGAHVAATTVQKLARALRVEPTWLLFGTGPMEKRDR